MQIEDLFTFVLNLVSLVLALGIEVSGVLVYSKFRGGTFAKPFLAFLLAPFFFVLAGLSDLLGNTLISESQTTGIFFFHMHDVFQFFFVLAILVAIVLIYRYWTHFGS